MALLRGQQFSSANILIISQVLIFVLILEVQPRQCGPGITTPGYTYPEGDIVLEEGQDLDITCVINEGITKYGRNPSSNMYILFNNLTQPVDILNSTAIRLHVANHPLTSDSDYTCIIKGDGRDQFVCHNIVAVGTKPKQIKDFDCIGYNYENMTCTFTAPKNYIATSYELFYSPSDRASRTPMECPYLKEDEENPRKFSCTWSLATTPAYRHAHKQFVFVLKSNNTFGAREDVFRVYHFAKTIPNPVEQLTAEATSPHSIKLTWTVPVNMQTFPGGLVHRVCWWNERNQSWIRIIPKIDPKSFKKLIVYEIKDLPYAHRLYDIRVGIKSAKANDSYWSQNATVTVRTKPKLPERPPATVEGSFDISDGISSKTVYWQNIDEYEKNGENLSYHIEVEGFPEIKPERERPTYAKFRNLIDGDYTFKIWSKNEIGLSTSYSVVRIPSYRYRLPQPSKLVKVDNGSGTYDLEWTPHYDDRVTSYTLFWCADIKDRPYQCDGALNWTVLPNTTKNITLKLPTFDGATNRPNNYQFAISSNGHNSSSGMLWAECTVIPGRSIKLKQPYVKHVTSTSITVAWKLECVKRGDVRGFNISHCPINSSTTVCLPNSKKFTFIKGSNAEEGEIKNLKPYTSYKIQIQPLQISATSQLSDPLYNLTFEATPSKVRNLKVLNKSDTSILIEWQKPEKENGFISQYNVYVNNEIRLHIPNNKTITVYEADIRNLTARSDYYIKVKACTKDCSEETIIATTEVGRPGKVPQPSANWNRSSLFIIRWEKPEPTHLKVDFYQVLVTKSEGVNETYNATDQNWNVSICGSDKNLNLNVSIRAVNILAGKMLPGPWSEEAYFNCMLSNATQSWVIIVILLGSILFVSVLLYICKRFYNYVRNMKNVAAKLPDGLVAVVDSYQEKEKHDDMINSDEPLISKFSSQPRIPSGAESSGCCSATASVSSSVESAGHLSISDSGTEQPQSLLEDVENRELRQRPIPRKDYTTMDELSAWGTKQPQSGYSVIGLATPPKKSESEGDYMALSEIPPKTFEPFEASKTPTDLGVKSTSGYVPYMPQEPAAKNTDYVLAGVPTKSLPSKVAPKTVAPPKESSSGYVTAPPLDTSKSVFSWRQQPSVEPPSTGYVMVGEATKLPKAELDIKGGSKGYVPHNVKFETSKSLKED